MVVTDAKTRLGVAWAALALITVGYLAIDHVTDHGGILEASTVITVGTILLALLKAKIIFNEFMDARHAPRLLRVATNVWILVMGTMLIGTYLVSQRLH
jgi:hypothetical protein